MSLQNAGIHAWREAEIVRVDDELPQGSRLLSEQAQLDAQELLRICSKILHQSVQFASGAVQIVVERGVDQQLSNGSLAGINLVENQIEFADGRLYLVAQFVAL